MIISERIFKILKEKNMSQNAFAKKVGLSGSTISDWKTKKTNPTAEKIIPICEALGVTPEQLLTGKDIDEDYEEVESKKVKDELELSKRDVRMIEDFHGLKDAQKKRLLKYMEALKQIEELENFE
ncbi:MAG: helix-turn-helix domain-containing protein [Lachnospiraceae bacterium]|nr:helix-turn-helix domain-containing protein [Lachnospiraceae bacterium]